jgi:hypothetical protein
MYIICKMWIKFGLKSFFSLDPNPVWGLNQDLDWAKMLDTDTGLKSVRFPQLWFFSFLGVLLNVKIHTVSIRCPLKFWANSSGNLAKGRTSLYKRYTNLKELAKSFSHVTVHIWVGILRPPGLRVEKKIKFYYTRRLNKTELYYLTCRTQSVSIYLINKFSVVEITLISSK